MLAAEVLAVVSLILAPLASGGGVSYVQSSPGLEIPGLEGGRTELELGDVNGDGHVDIVSIGDHGSPYINSNQHGVMVWFGDGLGHWSLFQHGDFGYGGVALGDVNGDGLMDVGYGMHHDYSDTDLGDQLLEVALGDGTGMSWAPWDDGLASAGESWGMFGTDFADIDNDGDLDVGAISFGCCAGIHVYESAGDGTWAHAFGFLGGNSAQDFAFGDVNGDGHADFAAAHGSGTVYLGDGRGGFALADGNLPSGPWRRGTALGDVNGDSGDDLAFVTPAGVQVWTWLSPGQWQSLSGTLASAGPFALTQIADMNLDGHGDVVALAEDLIRIWAGDGAGGWSVMASITLSGACDDAALRAGVDADHNGFPDVAAIAEENCGPFTGGTNRLRFYKEASVPVEPAIYPVRPRGGEVLVAGSVRFVDWHAAVPGPGPAPPITIELSLHGRAGPWSVIAEDVPNNGRFQWHLPAHVADSSDCFLRFSMGREPDAVALTPAPFTILGGQRAGDLDGDGDVDVTDLVALITSWGPCPPAGAPCPGDIDGDGQVAVSDLVTLILNWG